MPLPPVRGPRRVPHVVPEKIRPQPWFVYDNADRPDQGPPPSANWQTDPAGFGAGGFTVTSNVFAPTSAADNQMKWIPDTFGPYCDVSIDVPVLPGAGNFVEIELFDVFPVTSNGYTISNQLGSGTDLYRVDTGVGTSIAHTATDLTAGSTLRIRVTPTSVEGWIKAAGTWTNVLISNDTTYRIAFSVGIYQNNTTGRLDNFIATNGVLDDVVAIAPANQIVSPPAATASASAPTPTVQLQVAPAAATASASAPSPVMPIVVPLATASANSPPGTPQLQVPAPAATASASAPLPTLKIQVAPAAATASASASTPGVDVKVSPAAATASASAPIPGVALRVSPAAATASASAPIPTVTSGTGNQTVSPPAATASASAPTPTPQLRLSPPAATASASAPGPADGDNIPAPVATAAASAPVPTVNVVAPGTVNAPVATASASAPTPKVHYLFFDIAELWHHHETGLGEYPIAPGLSLNTTELFNQRYRDNSKDFPVTGNPSLTVDLEKLWDQKYRDTSVPFPVDQL